MSFTVREMKSFNQVVFLFYLAFILSSVIAEIVDIDDGRIEGTVLTSSLGANFNAFLRIPFAEAPIGGLRFEDPQEVKPRTETWNATYYGPMCVQIDPLVTFDVSEDCLHLNIFTKDLTALKPVLFYTHGGAFKHGTAQSHDPLYLMDRDLVVVTINYRLGLFGFLSTGTKEVPGNVGLKDMAMALKWVKKNIAKFGGDPNKITIGGLSAGSMASVMMMVSPMTKDLISGVIAISGASAGSSPLRREQLDSVKELAGKVQCTVNDIVDMITCLKTKPALELVSALNPENDLSAIWMPIVEPDFQQERFLPDDPGTLFEQGKFAKVSVMAGIAAEEFVELVPSILASEETLKMLNENFEEIAPSLFFYEKETARSKAFSILLKQSYFPFDTIDVRAFASISNIFSDAIMGYPVHRFVHTISNETKAYYYKFSYIGRHSFFKYPHDKPYGVYHSDDIQYLFHTHYIGPVIKPTDPEWFMVERMTKIVEQFVHTGNPNYKGADFNWPPHKTSDEFYMDIGTHMIEKMGFTLSDMQCGINMN